MVKSRFAFGYLLFFSHKKSRQKKISAAGKMAKMHCPCSNRSELAQTKATRPSHCPRSLPQRNPTQFFYAIFPKAGPLFRNSFCIGVIRYILDTTPDKCIGFLPRFPTFRGMTIKALAEYQNNKASGYSPDAIEM